MASPIFTPHRSVTKYSLGITSNASRSSPFSISSSTTLFFSLFSYKIPSISRPRPLYSSASTTIKVLTLKCSKSSEEAELSGTDDEWLQRLPDRKKPLYSHSLPCIEAWLKSMDFNQSNEDRARWLVENPDWHAQLSLDITDLYIRYLKNGPGNLEKDVERRFSYALSREDIENAILGGP